MYHSWKSWSSRLICILQNIEAKEKKSLIPKRFSFTFGQCFESSAYICIWCCFAKRIWTHSQNEMYAWCMKKMYELGNFVLFFSFWLLIDLIGNLVCTIKLHVIIYYLRYYIHLISWHPPNSTSFLKLSNFPLLIFFFFRSVTIPSSTMSSNNDGDDSKNRHFKFRKCAIIFLATNQVIHPFMRNFSLINAIFFFSLPNLYLWEICVARHSKENTEEVKSDFFSKFRI